MSISYPLRPLPELFQRNGYRYSLLRRSGPLGLYQFEHNRFHSGYEIIKLRAGKEPETWGFQGTAAALAKFLALAGSLEGES